MPRESPTLLIRPVDPHDEAELRCYQRQYELAERAELPDATVFSADDTRVLLTQPSLGWFFLGYAAFEHGEMVGTGVLNGNRSDSLHTSRIWAWVPPSERGRGVGSAIVDFLVDQSLALGRGILHSTALYPFDRRQDHPYRRFAERHGFTLANTEVERRLSLPVPGGRLADLDETTRRHAGGYRVRTVIGPLPRELAQDFLDVQSRLRLDAPHGELVVEGGRRTLEVLADQDRELQQQGRNRVTALALDSHGTLVAFSCAIVTASGQPHVDQWGTVVRPDHRGHRLGLAVKISLVRTIEEAFPDKSFIATTNAETNAHMVAINEALGFEPYALSADFQRLLPGFETR